MNTLSANENYDLSKEAIELGKEESIKLRETGECQANPYIKFSHNWFAYAHGFNLEIYANTLRGDLK